MKRLKRVGLLLISMTLLMSTTVFAATASGEALTKVRAKLIEAGVPTAFVQSIIVQIVEVPLTKSQADVLVGKIDSLKAEVGGRTTKSQFKDGELANMLLDAQSTAQSFGLNLSIAKDNTITVYDRNGSALTTETPTQLKAVALGIDTEKLKEAIYLALDYNDALKSDLSSQDNGVKNVANGSTSGTTDSIQTLPNLIMATALKQTGTNNGNLLVAGCGLMAVAGIVFVASRRRVLA